VKGKLVCPACRESFNTRFDLELHKRRDHGNKRMR